jgi:hypothetical protein
MDLGVGTRRSPGVAVFTAVTTGNDRMAGGGGDQQTEEEDEVAGIAEHLAHRHAGVFLLHRCVGAQVHALGARDGPTISAMAVHANATPHVDGAAVLAERSR